MTLRHMKIFVCVYRLQSITEASKNLHLAQPSVSLAIKELEQYYGVRLFDRISRRIYPTESGKELYEYAQHIVSLFDEMERNVCHWDMHSSLKIGSSITIGNFLLPAMIKKFQVTCPDVKIHAVIKNTETLRRMILDNQLDFALVEGDIQHSQIVKEEFLEDRLCLIVGPAHPLSRKKAVSIDDLPDYDLLLREPGSAGREMIESLFLSRGISVSPVWESASTQALIRGVMNNLGISILPYLLVQEELLRGSIVEVPVRDLELSRRFYIICHKHKYLSGSARAFMELCRS